MSKNHLRLIVNNNPEKTTRKEGHLRLVAVKATIPHPPEYFEEDICLDFSASVNSQEVKTGSAPTVEDQLTIMAVQMQFLERLINQGMELNQKVAKRLEERERIQNEEVKINVTLSKIELQALQQILKGCPLAIAKRIHTKIVDSILDDVSFCG